MEHPLIRAYAHTDLRSCNRVAAVRLQHITQSTNLFLKYKKINLSKNDHIFLCNAFMDFALPSSNVYCLFMFIRCLSFEAENRVYS